MPARKPGKYNKKDYHLTVSPVAHFIAQPSAKVQRISTVGLAADMGERKSLFLPASTLDRLATGITWEKSSATVKWEKGKPFVPPKGAPSGFRFLVRNRRRVLDQLAEIVAEHMRLGIIHADLDPRNILFYRSRSRRAPVKVKVVDYGVAVPLTAEWLDKFKATADYSRVVYNVVPRLAKGEKDREELRKHFERKFLEKIKNKF